MESTNKPVISLITPTHKVDFLTRLFESIESQTDTRFEWVIVPNNGADVSFLPKRDYIRIVPYLEPCNLIGTIKNFAFKQGHGAYLAEVDHDDELLPNCVESLINAAGTGVDFLFSDSVEIDVNDNPVIFGDTYGWRHYIFPYKGKDIVINKSFSPRPQTLSRILFAPNHIRAWKRVFYESIGGHDVTLQALDDQELMCRTYIHGSMFQIHEPLYVYHYHSGNSFAQGDLNNWIQNYTWILYEKYIFSLMERWSDLNSLLKIDLCGGINPPPTYLSVDKINGNVIHDLDIVPWPFPDNSVGVIRANDALEHLKNPITTMKEIHRILAPGGMLLSTTPSTDGRGAFQDPTHVSFWNVNSFWYYTRGQTAAYIGTPVRFQATRVREWWPSDWHVQNHIPYVMAHLTALKGGDEGSYAPGGLEI